MKYRIVLVMLCVGLLGVFGCVVQSSPRPVVGQLPTPYPMGVAVEFDRGSVRPGTSIEPRPGQKIFLGIRFKNTGEVKRVFYAAVTLRPMFGGPNVHLRPLVPFELAPGEEAEVLWEYTPEETGCWDVIFGVWGIWQPEMEPDFPIGHSGWFPAHLCAPR